MQISPPCSPERLLSLLNPSEAEYCHLGSRLPLPRSALAGSGFPAPAAARTPSCLPPVSSAHGGRRARSAQTKARAVGPTGPDRPPSGPRRPPAPRPWVPMQLCKREGGRRGRPQVPVRPGRPARAWAAGEGARGGRGAPRPTARAPAPATCPRARAGAWQGPPDGEAHIVPAARPAAPAHSHSHTPPARAAAGPGAPAGLPRSSLPRSGPALAAPPAAAAKLSPDRGGVASRPPRARQSVGLEVGWRVPPSAPPRAPDLVRLRFIVVVLGAHGHGHGSWWAQARAR